MPTPKKNVSIAPWNPPHADAQTYLESYIANLLSGYDKFGGNRPGAYTDEFDAVVAEELQSERGENEAESRLFPHQVDADLDYWGYYEYWHNYAVEMEEFRETLPEIDRLVDEAREAIRNGDAIEIVTVLDDLLELTGYGYLEPENVDNWSGLLADSTHSEDIDQDSLEIVRRRVLLAVSDLCERLCRIIATDSKALRFVEWRQLEQVIATALAGIGFDVILTPPSKDGGKDVVASCFLRDKRLTFYIEIKHWRSSKRVGSSEVFHFVEVNATNRTEGGLFLSSSGFAEDTLSQVSEISKRKVRLGGETKIVSLCQHFVRKGRGLWTPTSKLPEILFEQTIT